MNAVAVLAELRQAGAVLSCEPGGRVRFTAPHPLPPDLLAEARRHKDAIARLLAVSVDGAELPRALCPACGAGTWWRVSVLSGGPGPWQCQGCEPPPAATWTDATVLPPPRHPLRNPP